MKPTLLCSVLIIALMWHKLLIQLVSFVKSHRLFTKEIWYCMNWLQMRVFSMKTFFQHKLNMMNYVLDVALVSFAVNA